MILGSDPTNMMSLTEGCLFSDKKGPPVQSGLNHSDKTRSR